MGIDPRTVLHCDVFCHEWRRRLTKHDQEWKRGMCERRRKGEVIGKSGRDV